MSRKDFHRWLYYFSPASPANPFKDVQPFVHCSVCKISLQMKPWLFKWLWKIWLFQKSIYYRKKWRQFLPNQSKNTFWIKLHEIGIQFVDFFLVAKSRFILVVRKQDLTCTIISSAALLYKPILISIKYSTMIHERPCF